eukprot:9473902-Lingulodinium_polyedra.AAC.1
MPNHAMPRHATPVAIAIGIAMALPLRGIARHCAAWRGIAWRGVALRGVSWHGVAWRGVAWHCV